MAKGRGGLLGVVVAMAGLAGGIPGVAEAWAQPAETAPAQPRRPRRTPPPAQPVPAPSPAPADPSVPAVPAAPSPAPTTSISPTVAPARPAARAPAREDPELGPYLTLARPSDMTLTVRVVLNSDNAGMKQRFRDPNTKRTVDMPKATPFEFTSLGVVFPMVPLTASSELDTRGYAGVLTVGDALVDDQVQVLRGYPAGTQLGRWDAGNGKDRITTRNVELTVTMPMRCSQTVYDEPAALRVPWPSGAWPREAASALEPQLYVELGVVEGKIAAYDDATVVKALEVWLKEAKVKGPREVPPAYLAKVLAAKVWGNVQPSGDGLAMKARTGELAGIALQTPTETLKKLRGSEHDMAVLLAALYRKAGLPCRTVIGWDVGERNEDFLDNNPKQNKLRTWVEFCLYDEERNVQNWVPVDVARLRGTSNRPPAQYDRPWRFFGTHDELDRVLPFALHFHPPTDVVSYGSPGFWGWFVTPTAPDHADQSLSFLGMQTARGAGMPAAPEKPRRRGYGK